MNSFIFLEKAKLHTWEPVSIHSIYSLVNVLKNLIDLSAVPPPDTNNPCLCGDHASALTAAWCCPNFATARSHPIRHTISLLSFPPEAS
jgi:hypothetical protein